MAVLISLAAAAMAAPPLPGDDRTAILYTIRAALDDLLEGKDARRWFAPEATFPVVDTRTAEPKIEVRSLEQMLGRDWKSAKFREPFGVPTVLQDGPYAQVWVPYSFWIDGRKSHCGTDNVTLTRRGGTWTIVQFGFTMNPPSTCKALAAPETPDGKVQP